MSVELIEPPMKGRANVKVHAYNADTDTYQVSIGDTVGVEIPAKDLTIHRSGDFPDDYYDERANAWEGYDS